MIQIKDLSPLAFEIIKYLCKFSSNNNAYQAIDSQTFLVNSITVFHQAIDELQKLALIQIESIDENNQALVRINKISNVCNDLGLDLYLEEEAM